MNKHELTALAERVEQAEGPSRKLDAEICRALDLAGGNPILAPGMNGWLVGSKDNPNPVKAPAYTASIDAALTLVPEGSPMELHIRSITTDAYVWPDDREDGIRGNAATPALALVAAALRSQAQGEG